MISFDTPVDSDYSVYSRAHTAVVLPGVLSPLAWTLLGPALEAGHRKIFCRRFGLMSWPRDKEFLFVGRFGGRLYQNVSVIELIAARGPGPSPIGAELGLENASIPRYERRWTDRLWTLNSLPRGGLAVLRIDAWTRETISRVAALRADTDRTLERKDPGELVLLVDRLRQDLVGVLALQGTVRSFEMAAVAALQVLLDRQAADPQTASALLSSLPGLDATQPSLKLHALARWVATQTEVRDAVGSLSYEELRAAPSAPIRSFTEQFAAFLAQFGHRGVAEADPTAPAWEQQPDHLLRVIAALVDRPERDPLVRVEERRQLARRFVDALPQRHRVPVLATAAVARRLIVRSEVIKSALIQHVHQMRRCLWTLRPELSARLDPTWFTLLSWDELAAVAIGAPPPPGEELSRRQGELEGAAALDAPIVFEGSFEPVVAEVGAVTDMLVGLGAAPGAASGRAAVVFDPFVDPPPTGSVLVANATDTAWTPLFLTAEAVVTDLGTFMSHSSIVARELGIPAVVNTSVATKVIRTGQPTRVDGDRGVVFLGPPEGSSA